MSQDSYLVPSQNVTVSQEIKKSRFITYVAHTDSVKASDAFLNDVRVQYPDARHHCWARIVGAPKNSMTYGFSDDGEPSGTAGKPMLQQLMGSEIGELTAVVVRYFGGIKLGTGGLVRAYGSSTQQALDELQTRLKVAKVSLQVTVPFDLTGVFEHLAKQSDVSIKHREYGESIVCKVAIAKTRVQEFKQVLLEQGKGKMLVTGDDG